MRAGACNRADAHLTTFPAFWTGHHLEKSMGVKKTGKGRRKLGQKKRRMRARIRHRKG
jgi:hypothetical protein